MPATASSADAPQMSSRRESRVLALASVYYLLAAFAVTLWLWRDPASGTVAGNPNDADQFAWFFHYDAIAVAHGRLPALVTAAVNAPQGINVMWNTFMLLPGVLLAPVTLLAGPQTSLTVLMTAGFAGSAIALFAVLRRWEVGVPGAAIAGAVYGFSPALIQSSLGHYDLQFVVLPPLIADAFLRLATGRARPLRGGLWLGLLVTAQLLTAEEILVDTLVGIALITLVLVAGRPREALRRLRPTAAGLAAASALTLIVTGYPLWVQFFGPLHQHGSAFTPDYFKNDLTGLVAPSKLLLFHTAGSAAVAAKFQGGMPEYLAYVGWPLLVVLAVITVRFWRHLAVRATAVTFAVLEVFSLGGTLMISGTDHHSILLPWHWLASVPLLDAALPERFSIIADGAAAALLAFGVDQASRLPRIASVRGRPVPWRPARESPARESPVREELAREEPARWGPWAVVAVAVLAVLPLVPRPLPDAAATPVPAGWSATFAALHLPASARVLIVPVPSSTFTEPMRWQADTGQPGEMIGGYFTGPGPGGQAYIDAGVTSPTALFLNELWQRHPSDDPPSRAEVTKQLAAWQPAAVVAVTSARSNLGLFLTSLLGKPAYQAGKVVAWRS